MVPPFPVPHVLRFDLFELDVRAGELRKRGKKLRLQGQPLQVLGALLRRPGELVTREELRSEIWPADTFVDFDHSLHNAIARVREALGDSAESPRYIETLPRRGYRFIFRVIAADGSAASATPGLESPAQRKIRSLAVLPLEDHSKDAGQEYFADGMTEALITSLARIKALRVISRTSAMQYRGVRKSLPQIAQELNVDGVIEGSVLHSSDRIRIAVQLIRAETDEHLWAESYERDFKDILSLQGEIARRVADEVRIILTPEDRANLSSSRQVAPAVHELYLKARYFWNKRTEEGVRRSLTLFQEVIDRDPTFGNGYAGIADCYNILGYYNSLPPAEAYPKAKAAAVRALEFDPTLAEAHAALGVVKRDFEWDWRGAELDFRRAMELSPGYVEAHHWRSTMLSMLGQHAEAVAEKRKVLSMDPLSVVIRTDLARMMYFARDYKSSLCEFQSVLEMDPNFYAARVWMAKVHLQTGEFHEALFQLNSGLKLSNDSTYALAELARGHALSGNLDQARTLLHSLKLAASERYVSAYDLAMVHLALQETDVAFEWLQKALQERSTWLGYLSVEPQLDPIRNDPRFEKLRAQVGLP